MFSSPNPCRRIVKPRTSRGVRHTGAGEPVSRYRFTFYREFNNGQPDPVEQNALIMHHEIVPMKIKRGWLPTLDDVSRRLNKINALRSNTRYGRERGRGVVLD